MKKLVGFFAGIMILALTAALVHVSLRLYNYAGASRINAVLLQPAALWQNRISPPIALENISDEYVRNQLIAKFATEYLRVMPNADELKARGGSRGALSLMSSPSVMAKWRRDMLPELEKMAGDKKMRAVTVPLYRIEIRGDYFVVPFRTKTWNNPNDINAMPADSGGELYLKVRFNKKVRRTMGGREFNAGAAMDGGMPPSAVFEFMVDEVRN